jgi:hypothetical protein
MPRPPGVAMTSPPVDDFWGTGGIERNPEVARRLGQFLAEFASLEACLIWMLGLALGADNDDLAWSILGPIQAVTTRCQIVKDAAAQSKLDDITKAKVTGFVERIQRANAIRNEYVHAVYETNQRTQEVRFTPFALSTSRRKQTARSVDADDLVGHINQMHAIMLEVVETFFYNQIEPAPDTSPQK